MQLAAGARGRSLCLSELCGRSAAFARMLQSLEHRVDQANPFHYPPVGSLQPASEIVHEPVDAIGAVDLQPLSTETDPLALLVGLGAATDAAMPWQPPFIRDALAALPPVVDALRPVGAAIATAPAAAWWSSTIDLDGQYEVAGWNPDVTYRLCDVTAGRIEHWRRTSEHDMAGWLREQPGAPPPVGLP